MALGGHLSRPLLADEAPHLSLLELEVRAAVGFVAADSSARQAEVIEVAYSRFLLDDFFVRVYALEGRVMDPKPYLIREVQHPVAVDLLV